MFGSLEAQFAREHAIAIAKDRLGSVSKSIKQEALNWIRIALERWKQEQAADDGTIEFVWQPGLLGLAGSPGEPGPTLKEMSDGLARRRVSVSKLEPHQCAGIGVKCASDLLVKLWIEQYDPVAEIAAKIAIDFAVALLVERDGMTMPPDSLGYAVRLLWTLQRAETTAYREMLTASQRQRADIAARARAAKAERNAGAFARAEWKTMAGNIYRAAIQNRGRKPKRHTVACQIRDSLAAGANKKRLPSVATIEEAIKGVYDAVLADLGRSASRKPALSG